MKTYKLRSGGYVDFECRRMEQSRYKPYDMVPGTAVLLTYKWVPDASYRDMIEMAAKDAFSINVGNGDKIRVISPQFDFVSFVTVNWR